MKYKNGNKSRDFNDILQIFIKYSNGYARVFFKEEDLHIYTYNLWTFNQQIIYFTNDLK